VIEAGGQVNASLRDWVSSICERPIALVDGRNALRHDLKRTCALPSLYASASSCAEASTCIEASTLLGRIDIRHMRSPYRSRFLHISIEYDDAVDFELVTRDKLSLTDCR
jgi:hypothetical protein